MGTPLTILYLQLDKCIRVRRTTSGIGEWGMYSCDAITMTLVQKGNE